LKNILKKVIDSKNNTCYYALHKGWEMLLCATYRSLVRFYKIVKIRKIGSEQVACFTNTIHLFIITKHTKTVDSKMSKWD
jgi:hypothetical protein